MKKNMIDVGEALRSNIKKNKKKHSKNLETAPEFYIYFSQLPFKFP